jgi:type IV pilus secretin PilQ/predicted competence protein
MDRKIVRLIGLAALALTLAMAWAQTPPAVQKITVLPSRVNTRIVIDAGAPYPAIGSAYASGGAAVLQIEFGPARWPDPPAVPADEPPLVKDLKVTTKSNGRSLLSIGLSEKVPYRVFTEGAKTIIELEKIQRGSGDYLIAPETQKAIGGPVRPAISVETVDVAAKTDRLTVGFHFGRPALANVFALDKPLRLIVDVFDSRYSGPTEKRPVGKFGVESVRIGQFMSGKPYTITRIVFDLREARSFTLAGGAADFEVHFAQETALDATTPAAKNEAPPKTAPVEKKTLPDKPKTDNPYAAVPKPIDKEDPPPAVKTTPAQNPNQNPAQSPAQPPAQTPSQAKPKAENKNPADAPNEKFQPKTIFNPEQKFSGEVLSPHFKDADLRDVVLYIAERVGLNVIFDDEVKGTVTCSFDSVPWDQFLDIILRNKRLGKTLDGNILRIAPISTLTQEETEQQKLRDTREMGGPLLTKTYTLSFAKAPEVLDLLKARKSDRGQLIVDNRTNTLIVTDTKDKIDLIERMIEVLDTATPQVSIEARIVEATSNFVRNLGIQWGVKGVADPVTGNQTSLQFPNKILVDGALIPEGNVTKGIAGPLGGYAVNLPAAAFNSAIGISFANVLDTFRLDVALSAMETNGNGQIISSTKVTALNNKQAEVIQGRQIPVQTTANFTVTTQFVNAALQLRATPQITADGSIIMELDIQNNAADFGNLVNGIPPITTQSAKTQVMVPDGGTTVIGGISRLEDSVTQERVPFLHQIPILGALFKNFARTKQNRELLIFITPRIIR